MLFKPEYDENGKKILCEMNGINSEMLMDIYVKKMKKGEVLEICEDKNECAIFEYHGDDSSDTATINAKLMDNAGVLSSLMNELYKAGANVLSVNQSVPIHSVADVSVTVQIAEMTATKEELLNSIKEIDGVNSVVLS